MGDVKEEELPPPVFLDRAGSVGGWVAALFRVPNYVWPFHMTLSIARGKGEIENPTTCIVTTITRDVSGGYRGAWDSRQ